MGKSNFSTSYIPLEEPYQIIKYGKDIGMQIGTLVASCMVEGDDRQPFRIESHSYPVVAYADKKQIVTDRIFFDLKPMEGVVWNRVELRDVFTICLSGESLTWEDYIRFLWADIGRTGYTVAPQIGAFGELLYLGVEVSLPHKGKHVIHLHRQQNHFTKEWCVRSSQKDILAINFAWDDDLQKMQYRVMSQMLLYNANFVSKTLDVEEVVLYKFSFESDDDALSPLISILNNLVRDDWNLSALGESMFDDLSIKEQAEILNKFAFDAAKGRK